MTEGPGQALTAAIRGRPALDDTEPLVVEDEGDGELRLVITDRRGGLESDPCPVQAPRPEQARQVHGVGCCHVLTTTDRRTQQPADR